ncbi:cold shock domain-containing protein E1 isoform X3 [Electrophorus electricus]|uniref:cold shock domain-containing protein E1 isoform X3 n=1 Tax=Electrophorus electricus TaxID=8005 RepID=UPI0015CFC270|nr:cold shock domain-containing protein E1 isoform X3 [Electrophorus electricus]
MGVNEDISSEKYEGAVFQVVPRNFKEAEVEEHKLTQGLLDSMVEGTQKRLPFRSSDVITQATMMVGDRVYFKFISTNPETKEEARCYIKIQPDTLQSESEEQRKIGIIVKLDESYGFIKTPQDPELFFNLSEVMDDIKLIVGEKVEFTLAATEGGEEDKQAIRIRKLTESVFTSVPKLEAVGEKEKKKMTIRLLRDPKEQIKKEGKNSDLLAAVKQEKGKVENFQSC